MTDRARQPFPGPAHAPSTRAAASAPSLPACLAAVLAALAPPAAAQQPSPAVPPRLLEAAVAEWPAEEPVGAGRVEVACRVSLDETGTVVAVDVLESRGAAFDEAAVAGIRASTFAPAERDGLPVPSRFVFRWVFAPPVAPESVEGAGPEPACPERSRGVEGACPAEGPPSQPPPADSGPVPPPPLEGPPADPSPAEPPPPPAPEAGPGDGAYETVVRAQRPPREAVRHTIETVEIVRMPGSGGDALRVVENLPGVARPSFGLGFIVIRGSAPQNTAFYVEGVQVPLLYHFGALRSAIAGDLIERLDFYPGNYSVRYGGVTGGILDVVPRTPDRDAWSGYVDVNLIDAAAFAEGPLTPNASIAGGVRRSYLDAVLAGLGDVLPADVTQAPVYWDYQLLSDWDPTPDDRVRFFVYGSDDRFAVFFDQPDAGGPELVGERSVATSFHRFQAEWQATISDAMDNGLLLAVGYNALEFKAGPGTFDTTLELLPIQLRDEFSWQLSDAFQVALGIDTTVQWERIRLHIPDFFSRQATGRRTSLCALDPFEVVDSGWSWKPGFYLETELRPLAGLRLIPGIRFDLFDGGRLLGIDPRFNVRYEVVEGTTLKAGVGAYSQPPSFLQTDPGSGNPDLQPERAVHYGVGVEQELWGNLSLQVDGFYRETGNAIVASARRVTIGGEERAIGFENTGGTRAYGLEALLRYEPDDLFFGWLAVTLMEAESRSPRTGWRESTFDQLLNLTLVGSFNLGDGWSIGFRFRVAQGYPSTPVVDAVFDADCDQYEGIPGSPGSIRLPWFHQLDLRVDKRFEWEHFALAVYLDVQNVYYQENAEAFRYNYDYTERGYTTGLPILPALGLKGEFR
ncbi:MAG: TonB-dependent receptor [Deltaproteobacteria bacterium]|nr:TonB-dependent receptor [Deltaproteobacteria bacterium]